MKVLFIIQDERLPSSRVRVINLLPELRQNGIFAEVAAYPGTIWERISLLKRCGNFDATYLQKKLLMPFEAALLRRYARKLIFDFDDAIYYRHTDHDSAESASRNLKFKYLTRSADLVVAGNRILSEYASRFNPRVATVPSSVETRNIPRRDHSFHRDHAIIGWVGGSVNLPYLHLLSGEVFPRLSREHRMKVRILSNRSIEMPSVDVEFIPWRLDRQEIEIAEFDIGVMPLPDTKYTQGKCAYKALQYMAACVPPVCSDVGINRDIIEDGKEGFVVSSIDMFYNALNRLIKDPDLRQHLGSNARRKVEAEFSIEVIGKRLSDLLKRF